MGFPEFGILKKYCKSFNDSELGRFHSVFPFDSVVKDVGLSERRLGRKNIFSPSAKIALMVICPIVRGKEIKSVEFGTKVNNIQTDGISFIKHIYSGDKT